MEGFRQSKHLDGTHNAARPIEWIANVREAAKDFRRDLLAQSKVVFYRSFELVRVPYPTKYAYLNAFTSLSPFLHLVNRLFVIQFQTAGGTTDGGIPVTSENGVSLDACAPTAFARVRRARVRPLHRGGSDPQRQYG